MVGRGTYDITAAGASNSVEDSLDNYAFNSSASDEIEIENKGPTIELEEMSHTHGDTSGPSPVEQKQRNKQPITQDGGWGWVVVAAACLISICIDGLGFSFGLLREEMANNLGVKQRKISLIGSLFIALPLLTGPVMSVFVDRYGFKYTTIMASLLSTSGFLLASISSSTPVLSLAYSLFGGLGMGILYVTSIVSITAWFDRRRNLALTLASSGIGIGPIIYSNLIGYLTKTFILRDTLVILAGILLNICVCGSLMRHPDSMKKKASKVNDPTDNTVDNSLSSNYSSRSASKISLAGSRAEVGVNVENNIDTAVLPVRAIPKKPPRTTKLKPRDEIDNKLDTSTSVNQNTQGADNKNSAKSSLLSKILSDHNYLKKLTLHRRMLVHRSAMTSIPKYRLHRIERHDVYNNSDWSLDMVHKDNFSRFLFIWMTPEIMINSKVILKTRFLLFNLCSFGAYACSIFPYFFLNSLMSTNKMGGEVTMISMIGVGSVVGMILLPWAEDKGWINVFVAHASCLILSGVCVILYPVIISNFATLIFISLVYGITFASSYAFTPSIVMELTSLEGFTTAYGMVLLSQGLGHLIGPTIGGMLYDSTGYWDATFYIGGSGLIASGVCAVAAAFVKDPPEVAKPLQ